MRILFSGTGAFGHLLPMLPLARAARRAGHEVAVLTNEPMADFVGDLPVLLAGPAPEDLAAETARRTSVDLAEVAVDPSSAVEFLAGVRVDLTIDEALANAEAFGPDLIVCEALDFVGPMVAATLGVPWAGHGITSALPDAFTESMKATVDAGYAGRGLTPTARLAFVDPWPEAMRPDGWMAPDDTISLRPQAHAPDGDPAGDPWPGATFPGREDRPLVLVTLGTVVGTAFGDPGMLDAVLASVASEDVNVVATVGPGGDPDAMDVDRSRVRPVGFVPLERLLEDVDLVVSAAGAGTVLGTLGEGLPMVLVPVLADQPLNAERVAALGAAAVADVPERVGEAVATGAGRSCLPVGRRGRCRADGRDEPPRRGPAPLARPGYRTGLPGIAAPKLVKECAFRREFRPEP